MAFPTITAHSGCDGTPENTVESALKGLELGADFVEVDLRAGPGERLYLSHDEPATGAVGVTTFEALAAALRPAGGRINPDLKDGRAALLVGDAVREAGLEGRVVITGCRIERVRIVRERSHELAGYLNTRFAGPGRSVEEECARAAEAGCRGINIEHTLCSPSVVVAARARGLQVSVWTVAPEHGFERYLGMGCGQLHHAARGGVCRPQEQPRMEAVQHVGGRSRERNE